MAVSIPGCEPVALDFVGWPDSASPNPEEHLRLEWCSFRAGDLIVVDGKLFAAVFLVRFIALTSRLHAVKAALSSSSQALIAFSKASPWSQHHETLFIVPPSEAGLLARHHTNGGKTGTDVLSSIKLHASFYLAPHEFFLTGICGKAKRLPFLETRVNTDNRALSSIMFYALHCRFPFDRRVGGGRQLIERSW